MILGSRRRASKGATEELFLGRLVKAYPHEGVVDG